MIHVAVISTRSVGNFAKIPRRAAMLNKMPQMIPAIARTMVYPKITFTM